MLCGDAKSKFVTSSQEKAAKWRMQDGQMDGLTTNGVLVMHPCHGFSHNSKPGLWREISVCGNVFMLRETRSAQQRGNMVCDSHYISIVITSSDTIGPPLFHSSGPYNYFRYDRALLPIYI